MLFENRVTQVILIAEEPTERELEVIAYAQENDGSVMYYDYWSDSHGNVPIGEITLSKLEGNYSLELIIVNDED